MFNLKKNNKIVELILAAFLVLIGFGFRLLPHSPNFTPIAAIALFGGVYLSKKMALVLPIIAMVISDIFIGYYQTGLMIVVYTSFLLCVLLGFWLKNHKKWYTILGSSVAGSLIFFFLTNFAVWSLTSWYQKSISGLIECYLMALPFLKNTLSGDLFFATVFFGVYETVRVVIKKKIAIRENLCSKAN